MPPTLLSNSEHKALTTLERAKAWLEISGTSKDGVITLLINHATSFIEREVNRRLLEQTYTEETYDGNDTPCIVLKQFPVTALTKLEVNTSGDSTPAWQTIESSRYQWYEDGRIELVSGYGGFLDVDAGTFLPGPKRYRATYTAGYKINFSAENTPASHTLPGDLEYACLKLVAAIMNSKKGEGLTSARVGDVSVTYKAEVTKDPELASILGAHRAITI